MDGGLKLVLIQICLPSAELVANVVPDIYLYHNLDTHYDLLVKEDSRLAKMGLVGKAKIEPLNVIKCDLCDEICPDKSNLETHMEKKHAQSFTDNKWEIVKEKKNKLVKITSQEERLLTEEVITEEEVTRENLNEAEEEVILHKLKHNGYRRTDPQSNSEKVTNKECNFKCQDCSSVFQSQGLLDAHRNSHKTESFECDLCDKTFPTKEELEVHVDKHHEEESAEEWNCNNCPFQGNEAVELMNHLKETSHQPSSKVNKKKLFKEYKRCYTCNLEVDGYVNLMNHRTERHPSNRKCRNFPDDKCEWGKKCWYVHEEDLMEVDESFKSEEPVHKCYICDEKFKTRDDLKKHRKKKHPQNVAVCEKFGSNKCFRNEETCWFHHKVLPVDVPDVTEKQVFFKAQKAPLPPDHNQSVLEAIQKLTSKIEKLEKKVQDFLN